LAHEIILATPKKDREKKIIKRDAITLEILQNIHEMYLNIIVGN
jgi:hypothetical protein